MDSMTSLLRFLYLGAEQCTYSAKSKPKTTTYIITRLECIKNMAEGRYDLPFSVIKKVINNNSLPRNDEAMMALAYCVRCIDSEAGLKLRQQIYNSIRDVIHTDNDLFLFVKYSCDIVNQITFPSSKGFGRGMRKAIAKWYEPKTAIELVNIFGKNRGMHGWTHVDILKLCHLKFPEGDEKAQVIQAIFKKGWIVLQENEERLNSGSLPNALKRLCHIIKFKSCENLHLALSMIEQHDFGLAYIPSHLYEYPDVWEAIVSKMTYAEILKVLPTLYALNLLKTDSSLSKKMCAALVNQNLIKASDVHPLEIFTLKRNYEKNKRYTDPVKQTHFAQRKRIIKRNLTANPYVVKRFNTAVNHSLNFIPKVGASFFITLDLRHGNINHSVFGMNNVTCMEAMVLIALSIVKHEKNVHLRTFTDTVNLNRLVLNEKDSFDKAYKYCIENAFRRTYQSLDAPLKFAREKSKVYDVFLTITDSVARFCRQGKIPLQEFRHYKAGHKQAKYIVLNLRRSKSDLNISTEKGFLEICGLNASVPKLIYAFAKNQFS